MSDGIVLTPIGLSSLSEGDAQSFYTAAIAQRLAVREGTAASPDTTLAPLLKVERLINIAAVAISPSDGGELCSAIEGITVGTDICEAQPVGVYGAAKSSGTVVGEGGPLPDACGLYGAGSITGSGTGTGIGAYLVGRRENDTGQVCGLEVQSANYGTAAGAWSATGFQTAQAVWLNGSGNADSSAALVVSNAFGRQFKVGIGFTAQVTGGLTGGVADSTIRDDSYAATSLDIRGTHSGYGLDLKAGTFTSGVIRIPNLTGAAGKGIVARNAANTADHVMISYDEFDIMRLGSGVGSIYASAAFNVLAGLGMNNTNINTGTSAGTKIGTATSQKIGFYNATPIIQPSGTSAAATDLATVITLANDLRTKLLALGLAA